MSQTDFDQPVNRENTHAVKLDAREAVFGRADVLPVWVADMDFAAPQAVTDALSERALHPVYGYTMFPDSLYSAMHDWFRQRHQWSFQREWVLMAPGVVPSLNAACMACTDPGDEVIIQPPVYPPFFSSVRQTGRQVLENPLLAEKQEDGNLYYRMNLAHLEQCAARPQAKMLLLCSPHNPIGRVWCEAELTAVLDICRRHNLVLLSDEIHCDLVFSDSRRHRMLAALARPDDQLITAIAPSKTFNVPGLGLSAMVIANSGLRQKMADVLKSFHMPQSNPFSVTSFEAGYRHGGPWLDQLMDYLQANRDFVVNQVSQRLPGINVSAPEGTYLMWLDCRALGLDDTGLKRLFVEQAGVGMNPGVSFGANGSGFMRLNIGCPRATLEQVIERIQAALGARQ
ncbi:MalY/PatB family protein [Marinobacter sp. BSs20148]|uniref:MalY/PatB family protein n=1 Tax=Marinobacter sp. BSs20148 TaxID=490759 RepID=UPI0002777167|nr:PatB family C-S lyase [Marinobacter sp. BSs20148]AFP32645.1 Cystathionine beta-lyase PatB [Marinobacter sp. BSs20148]